MTPESFAYWLQGFFELSGTDKLTEKQVQIVKDHLALVFTKVTPERVGKKKKKVKKITDLPVVGTSETITIDPFVQPGVICTPLVITSPLEEAMKKLREDQPFHTTVTCSATPTADELMETVKESAKKSRECQQQKYPSATRWIGGGFGQKYC